MQIKQHTLEDSSSVSPRRLDRLSFQLSTVIANIKSKLKSGELYKIHEKDFEKTKNHFQKTKGQNVQSTQETFESPDKAKSNGAAEPGNGEQRGEETV